MRSIYRYLIVEEQSSSENKGCWDTVYGEASISLATVKNWFNEFQRGRITWQKSTITLFENLKKQFARQKFKTNEENIADMGAYFAIPPKKTG